MDNMKELAIKIVNYDIKKGAGGKRSAGKGSAYGDTLKYLIKARNISLAKFAKALGYTPQALNWNLNHSLEDNFTDKEVYTYCKLLDIDVDMFKSLVEEVKKIKCLGTKS